LITWSMDFPHQNFSNLLTKSSATVFGHGKISTHKIQGFFFLPKKHFFYIYINLNDTLSKKLKFTYQVWRHTIQGFFLLQKKHPFTYQFERYILKKVYVSSLETYIPRILFLLLPKKTFPGFFSYCCKKKIPKIFIFC